MRAQNEYPIMSDCCDMDSKFGFVIIDFTSMSLLNFPGLLWDWYYEYLWDYQRGSWVYSVSKSFRVMAWLAIVPFAFFIMLVRYEACHSYNEHTMTFSPGCSVLHNRANVGCNRRYKSIDE
jgi:hypothetical protein